MCLRRILYFIPKITLTCCYLALTISIHADNLPSNEKEKSEEKQFQAIFDQSDWNEVERVLLDEISNRQNRVKLHEQIALRLYGKNPCPGHIFIDWERMSTPKKIAFVNSSGELKVAKMTYYPVRKFLLASPQRFLGSTTNRPSSFVLEKQVDVREQLSIEWGSKVAVETCLRWTDAFQIYGNSVVFKSSSKLITHGKGLFITSKSLKAEIGSEINLSPDATSLEELAGTSAPAPNGANLDGIAGGNGKPGFPGGDLMIRVQSLSQIPKVISRGGKGGTGGQGSNGKNAVPGGPGAGNCPPEQGFELNYTPGNCGGVLTQNGRIITAYKWLGEINDPGGANGRDAVRAGAAGPGGIGGNGGSGGNVFIEFQEMTSTESNWDIDLAGGNPGDNGRHGTPGEGASGGNGVCKYWDQWESCGSFSSPRVLGIGKKGADASRGSLASYAQTNSSGVDGKVEKHLLTEPLTTTQLPGLVLQHLILQADDLFRQGSMHSLQEARIRYDEILSSYPDIERAFQQLTLHRIIALADNEANDSQLATDATDYKKIKIQFGNDVDYLFNAFHHRFLILAGLNYFGYSNEYVPSQSYEQIRIQFNELLAKYRNLYQKREFIVKELLAKLKEQKNLILKRRSKNYLMFLECKQRFTVPNLE